MNDDLGLFGSDEEPPRRRHAHGREGSGPHSRPGSRRRRRWTTLAIGTVLVVLAAALAFGVRELVTANNYADYAGSGGKQLVVGVEDGDTTSAIAKTLQSRDVVASRRAFLTAASDNEDVQGIQPGYYVMRAQMSGSAAVDQILNEEARVGQVEIRPGTQLDDTSQPDGTKVPGTLSLLAKGTCAELNGSSTCLTAKQLRTAMTDTPASELGVPTWATKPVSEADPRRKLEGLIMPGRYNVRPGASATEVLTSVLESSAFTLQTAGLPAAAEGSPYSPYQIVVISSLVEKEGITKDFGKVARVIWNRLQAEERLRLDATVNYPLDLQEVRTTDEARNTKGPYNSYLMAGLPPTPIAAASSDAIGAAANPPAGEWKYFVKCQEDGSSCFAVTNAEHQKNVAAARERGVF